MTLQSGTRLGPYEVLSPLGAGAMGEVYKAKDPKLDRFVAIKVLPMHLAADPDSLLRFEREAKALGALSHPNILGIFDFGNEGETAYAVMELLEGETLRELLQKGAVPLRRALDIAQQMAIGLAAAHAKGIIHRDLKPENVFILKDERVKLLDFGLAKRLNLPKDEDRSTVRAGIAPGTAEGMMLGTVGYMAPEQVRGGTADARSDLFSLGCVLFELLVGHRAFAGASPLETLHSILHDDPFAASREIPVALWKILVRCLDKNPERRFQSAQDLAFAMEDAEVGSSPGILLPIPRSRRRWIWAAALGLVAAGAATMALIHLLRPPPLPVFTQLTFHRGHVFNARFAPDGHTVFYGANWGAEAPRLFSGRSGNPESRTLAGDNSSILSSSRKGDLALLLNARRQQDRSDLLIGDLAVRPAAGGEPRILTDGVLCADFRPGDDTLAVARIVGERCRLEYPLGHMLFEAPGWISHLRFDPSGQRLAYLSHPEAGRDPGSIELLELKEGQRTPLSEGWEGLDGLAWSPKGKEIWFTGSRGTGARALYAISLGKDLRPIAAASSGYTLHDISPAGRVLLCQRATGDGVLGKAPDADPTLLEVYEATRVQDLSWDGHWVALEDQGLSSGPNYSIFIRSTEGSDPIWIAEGNHPALSPDGTQILVPQYQDGSWRFYLHPRRIGESQLLPFKGFTTLWTTRWSPDGRSVFACGTVGAGGLRVWRVALDDGSAKALSPEDVDPSRPFRISPDGQWLALALGPVFYRLDLSAATAVPQPIPGIGPKEIVLGWGDDTHILVAATRTLPCAIQSVSVQDGTRSAAFVMPGLGHEGAQLGPRAMAVLGGKAYAASYSEPRSKLYLVDGLR